MWTSYCVMNAWLYNAVLPRCFPGILSVIFLVFLQLLRTLFWFILQSFTVLVKPKEGFCSIWGKWHCWKSLLLKMFRHFISNRIINKKPAVVCYTRRRSSGCLQLSVLPFISLSSPRREGMGLGVLASDEKLPSSPGHLNKPWPSPTQHPPLSPQICLRFHHPQKTNSHGQTWDNHLFG